MLNLEDNYHNSQNDFDEINKTLEQIDVSQMTASKKQENDEEKLPFFRKLALFLCGFAYCGLILIATIMSLIFGEIFTDKSALQAAVQTSTYIALLIVLFCIAFPYRKYFINNLKDVTKYLYGILFGLMTIAIEIVVSKIINYFFPSEINANQEAVEQFILNYPTLMFFITVLIGPFCEEITYRVGLYEMIREKNETVALIVTSLIFAFVHIQFTETTFRAEATAFPIYLVIGFMLTYTYKKQGLPGSFVAHAMLNAISFLSTLVRAKMV
jgi:hypothetical protein